MKDILKDIFKKIREGDIRLISSSLAYTTVLSIIPFLALSIITFKMVGGIDFLIPKIEGFFLSYVKEAIGPQVSEWIRGVLEKMQAKTIGTTAVIALYYTSWRLFSDMERGIQRIWSNEKSRPIHRRFLVVWISILVFPALLAFYVAIRSLDLVRPFANAFTPEMDGLALFAFLYLVYKLFPADKVLKRVAFSSATFSCIGITILQKSFTYIAKQVFYTNKFYGSLAAIPLILMWILILWKIILTGTALGSALQRKLLKKTEVPIVIL